MIAIAEPLVTDQEMADALNLAKRIASHMRAQSFAVQRLGEPEDVAQIGAVGVLDAARRFNRSRGLKFTTFAGPRIRGAILDAARDVGIIKTPRLALERGESAEHVDSLERIRAFHQNESGNDSGWEPSVGRRRKADDDAAFAVERFLQSLTRKERSIVRLYFGLGSGMPLTMKEIAGLHGLSESRVSQMMSQIFLRAGESHFFAELN